MTPLLQEQTRDLTPAGTDGCEPRSRSRLSRLGLLALIGITSAVVSWCVSPWLVPPYLLVMGWLLLAPSRAIADPKQGDDVVPVSSESCPLDRQICESPDPAEQDSDVEEGAMTAPSASEPEPGSARPRKGKGRGKGKAKPATGRPEATWVQVGPGKFVRVEVGGVDGVPEPHGDGLSAISPESDEIPERSSEGLPSGSPPGTDDDVPEIAARSESPVLDTPASEHPATSMTPLESESSPDLDALRIASPAPSADTSIGGSSFSTALAADLDQDGRGSCIAQVAPVVEAIGRHEPRSEAQGSSDRGTIEVEVAQGDLSSRPEAGMSAAPEFFGVAETRENPAAGPVEDGSRGLLGVEDASASIDVDHDTDRVVLSEVVVAPEWLPVACPAPDGSGLPPGAVSSHGSRSLPPPRVPRSLVARESGARRRSPRPRSRRGTGRVGVVARTRHPRAPPSDRSRSPPARKTRRGRPHRVEDGPGFAFPDFRTGSRNTTRRGRRGSRSFRASGH